MTFFRRPLLIVPFQVLPYKFHCKFHAQGLVIPCWPSHLCHLHVGWSAIFDLPHYHPLHMGWSYIFDHATCASLAHGLDLPLSLFSHFHPSYNYTFSLTTKKWTTLQRLQYQVARTTVLELWHYYWNNHLKCNHEVFLKYHCNHLAIWNMSCSPSTLQSSSSKFSFSLSSLPNGFPSSSSSKSSKSSSFAK